MVAIIIRIARQLFNDKRSLALMLFAPMFIMTFLYLIFGDNVYKPKLALVDIPSQMESAIRKQDVVIVKVDSSNSDKLIEDGKVDGVLSMKAGVLNLHLQKADAVKAPKLTRAVSDTLKSMSGGSGALVVDYHYGSADESAFKSLGYMFLGVFSFFFVFLISGVSFIKERIFGTVERFMLAPVSRYQVVGGYWVLVFLL